MNCPGCGYKNEEGAKACNLCGKLLITKAPPPPVPVPAVAALAQMIVPGLSDDRVPSWPNRAILCLLFTPALTLIISPLLLSPGEYEDDFAAQRRMLQFLGMVAVASGCLVGTIPMAARMAFAPLGASILSVIGYLIATLLNDRMGTVMIWPIVGGLGMAWYARSSFTRPWDPAKLFSWTLGGYKRLLRPDRWAGLRLAGGVLLFLGGIAFMLAIGTEIGKHIGLSRPLAKILAIPAFIGGFVAANSLSLSESKETA